MPYLEPKRSSIKDSSRNFDVTLLFTVFLPFIRLSILKLELISMVLFFLLKLI